VLIMRRLIIRKSFIPLFLRVQSFLLKAQKLFLMIKLLSSQRVIIIYQISEKEAAMNKAVYALFGLSEEEVGMVEG